EEVFLEKVIQQIGQRRRDRVVVLGGDNHIAVRPANNVGETLEYLRRLAALVFLVHSVQERQRVFDRIDQRHAGSGALQRGDGVASDSDAEAVTTHAAEDDGKLEGHDRPPRRWATFRLL